VANQFVVADQGPQGVQGNRADQERGVIGPGVGVSGDGTPSRGVAVEDSHVGAQAGHADGLDVHAVLVGPETGHRHERGGDLRALKEVFGGVVRPALV
jgi:hypothetical protein